MVRKNVIAQCLLTITSLRNDISMKHIVVTLICGVLLSSNLLSQKNIPELTLKVSEKSGFLGMGKPRFVKIALSSRTVSKALTSDTVNGSSLYYFTVKDSGGWKIDDDFIKDELKKMKIEQDGASYGVDAVGSAVRETDHYLLLISCKKNVLLHKPFTFVFPLDKVAARASMEVPQEYWPGYTKFTTVIGDAEKALSGNKLNDALTSYEQLLQDQSLKIFPEYETISAKRLTIYQKLFNDHSQKFQEMLTSRSVDTKQKIALSEEFNGKFLFISENAATEKYLNQTTRAGASDVADNATAYVSRSKFVRDSLAQALDEQTIRFIVQGSSVGKIDFKYKYIIETLAYAYSSVNFADTSALSLKVVVSEELTARLQKYALMNAYETFVRVVNNRWVAKRPMYPIGFLQNLVKDTAQFPLPYYSILKAVQDFYKRDYASAKSEIHQVMKKSYAYELTERIDQLRILIITIEKNVPAEALQRLNEGYRAEERGENEKAIEHYKDAMLIADDYAPAAFALGKLYDRTGDSDRGNNFFQKAVTADSQYYTAYRFLYNNFFRNANFKPMIDLLTQSLAYGNDFFDIHFYLGIAYNGSAQYDLAILQYERALELNNKSINANIQAGISYQNMKSFTKARDYFKRAIVIDPENQTATENLKRLDELQKKF
jgi:tetratricopeptide (TPR) repeat protein